MLWLSAGLLIFAVEIGGFDVKPLATLACTDIFKAHLGLSVAQVAAEGLAKVGCYQGHITTEKTFSNVKDQREIVFVDWSEARLPVSANEPGTLGIWGSAYTKNALDELSDRLAICWMLADINHIAFGPAHCQSKMPSMQLKGQINDVAYVSNWAENTNFMIKPAEPLCSETMQFETELAATVVYRHDSTKMAEHASRAFMFVKHDGLRFYSKTTVKVALERFEKEIATAEAAIREMQEEGEREVSAFEEQ